MDFEPQDALENNEIVSRSRGPDPGIVCLTSLLRFHGLPADPAMLTHQLGAGKALATWDDLVRLARRHGLKARAVQGRRWEHLTKTPLPDIAARSREGRSAHKDTWLPRSRPAR